MPIQRNFSAALALAFVLSLAGGCSTGFDERGYNDRDYALHVAESRHSLLNLPVYLALEAGFFREEGLAVGITAARSPEKALRQLLSGSAQLALLSPEAPLYHFQQGNKPPVVYLAQTSRQIGHYLVARDGGSPFSWQALKGKVVIGAPAGDVQQVVFEYLLKKNSLRPHLDIHLIQNLPGELSLGAFQAGTGHFLLAAEPTAAKAEIEHGFRAVASLDALAGPLVTGTVITNHDFYEKERDACARFVRAVDLALQWLDDRSPEEIVSVIKKEFPQEDEKVLLRAVSRYKNLGLWPVSAAVDREGLDNLQSIMLERKELNERIDVDKLIAPTGRKSISATGSN